MKDLIIICHDDHLVSGSVHFVRKLLEREFNVRVVAYDGGISYVELLYRSYPRAVFVLFQTDFLAPWLCAHGGKVVIIPMYDACARAPRSYFRLLDNGYLFSFSNALHEKCTRAGIVSYKLNYYPETPRAKRSGSKRNRLFYWRRRPHSVLTEQNVKEFFAPYIEEFHIHDRPDAYTLARTTAVTPDNLTSVSNWFPEKSHLTDLISSSRFYLAPRQAEGIGMAFLEAMSHGCIVFANKNSTHNQYIYHGRTGFLIDFESENEVLIKEQIKEAFEIIHSGVPIGENARKFILNGAPIWKTQAEKMLNMVVALGEAEDIAAYTRREKITGYVLAASFYKFPALYFLLSIFAEWIGSFSPRTGVKYAFLRTPWHLLRYMKRKLTGRKYY